MKKDIELRRVEDIIIAIIPPEDGDNQDLWDVYLINLQEKSIDNLLVSSVGYGEIEGEMRKTTTLRYFFEHIGPLQVVQIEPIQSNLFDLTHEYWISYNQDDYMYDRKYVFVSGSIHPMHFTSVPLINKRGVMIR
jgi:hypothetical protein